MAFPSTSRPGGSGRASLEFLVANVRAKFTAAKPNGNVVADLDLGGVTDDTAGSVARNRIAPVQNDKRAAFVENSCRLGQPISPLDDIALEYGSDSRYSFGARGDTVWNRRWVRSSFRRAGSSEIIACARGGVCRTRVPSADRKSRFR